MNNIDFNIFCANIYSMAEAVTEAPGNTSVLDVAFGKAFGEEAVPNSAAGLFIRKGQELIWQYSPDVKLRTVVPRKFEYTYVDPGTASTPKMRFYPAQGKVYVHIEGTYPEGTTETNISPKSLSLVVTRELYEGSKTSTVTLDFNPDGSLVNDSLPPDEEIFKGVRIQDWLIEEYANSGTKEAPSGVWIIDPMPGH